MATGEGPSDWLARLNDDELAEYIGDDDNSGELRAASPDSSFGGHGRSITRVCDSDQQTVDAN